MPAVPIEQLERQFLSYRSAEAYCGVSESTLKRMVRDGALRVHRVGRRVLIGIEDLRNLVGDSATK